MRFPAAAVVATLLSVAPALAKVAPPAPLPERVARARVIVVGKVTGFGDKLVPAKPYWAPDGEKVEHQVANVEVRSVLLGDDKIKTVKIGFVPNTRRANFSPQAGEEGLYFLAP